MNKTIALLLCSVTMAATAFAAPLAFLITNKETYCDHVYVKRAPLNQGGYTVAACKERTV